MIDYHFLGELGFGILTVAFLCWAANRTLNWYLDRPAPELQAHPNELDLDITVDEDLDNLIAPAQPTPEPSQLIVREGWDRDREAG